jgi:tetratricopeptide (TPR) repeat protein
VPDRAEQVGRVRAVLADRYRIERELGRGGMATVYLAEDLKHHRQVAIKVLSPELAAAVGPERFLREIEIAANLTHPHILPLFDSGEAGPFLYYVMPYVEGESLRSLLNRKKQLPVDQAVDIAKDVALALGCAHRQGVVHRDIKPENILLHESQAMVADFGIALALSAAGGERLTETGISLGTPHYMSPEQATGDRQLDAATDLYSLGCVLYEMLTGDPPHLGSTAQAVIAKVLTEKPTHVTAIRDTVPPHVGDAVSRALARVPADRFATAEQLVEALLQPIRSHPRLGDPHAVSAEGRRRRIPRALGVVAAASAAAAVVYYALGLTRSGASALEADRVLVLPLVTPQGIAATAGEDVSTMIGHALDGAADLRAIDGWTLLDEGERENIRDVTLNRIRELAASRRCAYALTGRLVLTGADSVEVLLSLQDVAGDSTVSGSSVSGALDVAWRSALIGVTQLLPAIIEGAPPEIHATFSERSPAAMANFLKGEAAFRRAHFEEAFRYYQAAVAADSSFGLAALRGAQAAAWLEDLDEASVLTRTALARPLSKRYAALARGMLAYLEGDAHNAISELEAALAVDDELAFAWIQLGEVYTHLVVRQPRPDSLARAAFARAHALDSAAANVLYHLLEYHLRRGDVERAQPLVERFQATGPDEALARPIGLMWECAHGDLREPGWQRAAMQTPGSAIAAAFSLAGGGGYGLACAESGFRAILAADTSGDVARKWGSVKGLLAVLVAQGRDEEAGRFLDSTIAAGYGFPDRFYPVGAMLGLGMQERAAEAARSRLELPLSRRSSRSQWYVGTWAAHQGDTATVAAVVLHMEEIAAESEVRYDSLRRERPVEAMRAQALARRDRLLADAMGAHLALARGDTTDALRRFRVLRPNAPRSSPPGFDLSWDELEPLPLEQLRLAQLLLAKGHARETLEVAGAFDAPDVLIYVLYLRESLEIRIRAANVLGDGSLAASLRARLAAMQGSGR